MMADGLWEMKGRKTRAVTKEVTALMRLVRVMWSRSCVVNVGLLRPTVAKASAESIVSPGPGLCVEKRKQKDD